MRAAVLVLLLLGLHAVPAGAATVSLETYEAPYDRGGGTYTVGRASIAGTDAPERLRIERPAGELLVTSPDGSATAGPGCTADADADGAAVRCAVPAVGGLDVLAAELGGGDDELVYAVPGVGGIRVDGGAGADRIDTAASNRSTILGGPGNDVITAGGGDNQVSPGAGSDTVELGASAAPWFDTVSYADLGTPLRADLASGTIASGTDVDRITGTYGLVGSAGDDVIAGTPGPDRIDGGAGSDTVLGGDGVDTLKAQTTAPGEVDVLDGGADVDELTGIGAGVRLVGGAGDDRLELYRSPQPVDCGTGTDRLDLSGLTVVAGCEAVRLDVGAVTVTPGSPDAGFRARVRLRCPPGYGHPCPAVAELRAGGYLLTRRRLTVRRQRPRTVSLRLGAEGRRQLAASRPFGLDVEVWVRMRARRADRQVGLVVHLRDPAG